jgi:hypothetical protein
MANEAVVVINPTRFTQLTVDDQNTIEKGTLLGIGRDPNIATGAFLVHATASLTPFAGIAWTEKVANDGKTTISAALDGEFDLTVAPGAAARLGELVALSGSNYIRAASNFEIASGAVVGRALETGSASEVIRVRLGY